MAKTTIEWTNRTWNPVTGCTKVSPGCDNCYMYRQYPRLKGMGNPSYQAAPDQVTLIPKRLEEPLHWRKPQKVFVCSTSDLFHKDVPWEYISKVFWTMASSKQHTFQVLTKRTGRMAWFAKHYLRNNWPDNVWAGTSVERQKYVPRLKFLAQMKRSNPNIITFGSCEPLLGLLDLRPYLLTEKCPNDKNHHLSVAGDNELLCYECGAWAQATEPLLDWVIVGGESGPGARPMHPDHPRRIRDDCQAAGVPFFFKQWGEYRPVISAPVPLNSVRVNGDGSIHHGPESPHPDYHAMARVGRKAAGSLLDGREWKEMPS